MCLLPAHPILPTGLHHLVPVIVLHFLTDASINMAYSFLELAAEVLESASAPLTYQQCWEEGKAKGLTAKVKTMGKTLPPVSF